MAIFADIKVESTVQIGDKTRIDAAKSFSNEGEVFDLVEIAADGVTFIDVTNDLYLDTVYSLEQVENPVVRVTSGVDVVTATISINVISAATDNLFSSDSQLVQHEDDILSYLREGRDSYLDKHRLAQSIILNDLDRTGVWKQDGTRFTADEIVDIQEFKEWSKYLVLKLIFESMSNQVEDIFFIKASRYNSMAIEAKKRAVLRLDVNDDGSINENSEKVNILTGILKRG